MTNLPIEPSPDLDLTRLPPEESRWVDLTEREAVAKAIRDVAWSRIKPEHGGPPSQAYADTLPLTEHNLVCADAAIAALDLYRGVTITNEARE